MDVSKTLAKRGLAFRGHDETASSLDKGNFREIIIIIIIIIALQCQK